MFLTSVYPRACGGTSTARSSLLKQRGLSPRVRGNPPEPLAMILLLRSIPARAGEPAKRSASRRPSWVYPRACGGTRVSTVTSLSPYGLSPRVRGNQELLAQGSGSHGSIPARAGEPSSTLYHFQVDSVYPRACGGTPCPCGTGWPQRGLSPRVRGNRDDGDNLATLTRSIPARAGEPPWPVPTWCCIWVYPRACGGTMPRVMQISASSGLSPRVRGNPLHRAIYGLHDRSIPARAGEPASCGTTKNRASVYPRACGGTTSSSTRLNSAPGLSPRVRGNPVQGDLAVAEQRSIPARAGEPPAGSCRPDRRRVYPRACGGTLALASRRKSRRGLSPRVRGNRGLGAAVRPPGGSIPARAGEPSSPAEPAPHAGVYPRACGGTLLNESTNAD